MAKTYSRREILRLLRDNGYVKVKGRGKGSHESHQLGDLPPITIPHGKDVRIGTVKRIMAIVETQVAQVQV